MDILSVLNVIEFCHKHRFRQIVKREMNQEEKSFITMYRHRISYLAENNQMNTLYISNIENQEYLFGPNKLITRFLPKKAIFFKHKENTYVQYDEMKPTRLNGELGTPWYQEKIDEEISENTFSYITNDRQKLEEMNYQTVTNKVIILLQQTMRPEYKKMMYIVLEEVKPFAVLTLSRVGRLCMVYRFKP